MVREAQLEDQKRKDQERMKK